MQVKITNSHRENDNLLGDIWTHTVAIETDAGAVIATVMDDGSHMEWSRFEPSDECWDQIMSACREVIEKD